jgi:excisionase family DNA binding protein
MTIYDKTERLLTVAEVSEMIHVHPNTLRRWADEGTIAACRISIRGDRRFKPSDVADFLTKFSPVPESKRTPPINR